MDRRRSIDKFAWEVRNKTQTLGFIRKERIIIVHFADERRQRRNFIFGFLTPSEVRECPMATELSFDLIEPRTGRNRTAIQPYNVVMKFESDCVVIELRMAFENWGEAPTGLIVVSLIGPLACASLLCPEGLSMSRTAASATLPESRLARPFPGRLRMATEQSGCRPLGTSIGNRTT